MILKALHNLYDHILEDNDVNIDEGFPNLISVWTPSYEVKNKQAPLSSNSIN